MNILLTGGTGFLGSALCSRLASDNKVIGIYNRKKPVNPANIAWEHVDLTDVNAVAAICEKYSSDVVVHLAALLHIVNPPPEMREKYERINIDQFVKKPFHR